MCHELKVNYVLSARLWAAALDTLYKNVKLRVMSTAAPFYVRGPVSHSMRTFLSPHAYVGGAQQHIHVVHLILNTQKLFRNFIFICLAFIHNYLRL